VVVNADGSLAWAGDGAPPDGIDSKWKQS
jgi:hypothetical protein